MMEENNDIFLAGGDVLVYLAEPMHKKNIPQHCLGPSIQCVRILGPIFQPPSSCKHMYAFRVTVTVVALFQKILLNNRTYVLNNMTQMLQVNKNSNIKYNNNDNINNYYYYYYYYYYQFVLSWQNRKKFYKNNYRIVAIPLVVC